MEPFGNNTASGQATWIPTPQSRFTADIIWSCVLTLSLCVWKAFHINIPPFGSPKAQYGLKTKWMLLGLLIPEHLVFTAGSQWTHARALTKSMKRIRREIGLSPPSGRSRSLLRQDDRSLDESISAPDWTMTHSYHALMGGYAFDVSDEPGEFLPNNRRRVFLTKRGVEAMAAYYSDAFPRLSVDTIRYKSKADEIAKFLVFIQALWFSSQCLDRIFSAVKQACAIMAMSSRLDAKPLEEPNFPIDVKWDFAFKHNFHITHQDPENAHSKDKTLEIINSHLRTLELGNIESLLSDQSIHEIVKKSMMSRNTALRAIRSALDTVEMELPLFMGYFTCSCPGSPSVPASSKTPAEIHRAYVRRWLLASKALLRQSESPITMPHPLSGTMWLLLGSFVVEHGPNTSDTSPENSAAISQRHTGPDNAVDQKNPNDKPEAGHGPFDNHFSGGITDSMHNVVTPYIDKKRVNITTLVFGMYISPLIYGGLHCLSWNLALGSTWQHNLWCISIVYTMSTGLLLTFLFVYFWIGTHCLTFVWKQQKIRRRDDESSKGSSKRLRTQLIYFASRAITSALPVVLALAYLLYLLARVFILVQCFIQLAPLPSSAYVGGTWSPYLPHI